MIYFVTGTDTGAGKTFVTATLVRALRIAGLPARALKPIETGWPGPVGDTDAVHRAVSDTAMYHDVSRGTSTDATLVSDTDAGRVGDTGAGRVGDTGAGRVGDTGAGRVGDTGAGMGRVGDTDAGLLAAASGRTVGETNLVRLALPRSPKAAAQAAGRAIDVEQVAEWCRRQEGDPLLVEGAGGWMVPIKGRTRMRDLAARLEAEVIVVAKAGLGTINHAILTVEAVRATAPMVGVVLSRRPEDDLAFARENAVEIAEQTGARVAIVPEEIETVAGWLRRGGG